MEMYVCCICDKEYIQRGRLKRHLVSKHRKSFYDDETEALVEKSKTEFKVISEKFDTPTR